MARVYKLCWPFIQTSNICDYNVLRYRVAIPEGGDFRFFFSSHTNQTTRPLPALRPPPPLTASFQVKVSFDDENFSFWDPFKHTGFNASATVIPLAEEAAKRAPGYLAYATLATGFGLFLPPKAIVGVNVAYVVAAVARSHEGGVETFCKDEGRLLLGSPSVHLALVGTALRALRFRAWRGLFVRATLFRLRYQVPVGMNGVMMAFGAETPPEEDVEMAERRRKHRH